MNRLTRRSFVLATFLLLSTSVAAFAQEVSLGCYLVPRIAGVMTTYMPKYINRIDMPGRDFRTLSLGLEPEYLVCAALTAPEHTFVSGQSDVFAFPANLDSLVGGNPTLNRVRNALEQRNVSGDNVSALMTWRQVIGIYGRYGQILQRLNGRNNKRLFPPGVSLDSTPDLETFTQLVEAATSLGLDASGVESTMIIRDIMFILTVQIPPFKMFEETF